MLSLLVLSRHFLHARTANIERCTLELVLRLPVSTPQLCIKQTSKGFKRGLGRRKLLGPEEAAEIVIQKIVPALVEKGLLAHSCRLGADGVG